MKGSQDLERFLEAQERNYDTALAEIKRGRKRSHWMWYIFPQIQGLGMSDISRHYAIKDIGQATEYLTHETLGARLTDMCKALLELPTNDAYEIFGNPDDLKLRSSMTLFDAVPKSDPIFSQVLDKFYHGKRDKRTLDILKNING